jgi:hypothetical protein
MSDNISVISVTSPARAKLDPRNPPLPPPPPPPLPKSKPSSLAPLAHQQPQPIYHDYNDFNSSSNESSYCSQISTESNCRSALLKSIENFKGGLKPIDSSYNQNNVSKSSCLHDQSDNNNNNTNASSNNGNGNDLFNQLFNALNNMRPFLNISSDESGSETEEENGFEEKT